MATITGAASFKKKLGMLSIYEEETPPRLQWKAIDDNANVEIKEVTITLDQVTNLQATPLTSAKLALNIIMGDKKNVFSFNSREIMNNIKQVLQQSLLRKKQDQQESGQSTPVPQGQVVVNDEFLLNLLDLKKLLKNHQLQQRLLKENKNLMSTFREAVMNNGLDPQEFWNTRIHLLRSYLIQNNQKRGSYNVLSTIKPVATSDNEVNVSVTREKIHSIFEQYPVVRKIYNDNVPKKFGEGVFWSRFFSSKLFRKLRGEKNYNNAKVDFIFDKYLHVDPDFDGAEELENEAEEPTKDLNEHHVNKLIDLTGNELDVSEKMGNGPDYTMRFDNKDRDMVSILKSMNRLSKKMVSNTKEDDQDVEMQMEQELELSDLEDKELPEYNELNIKRNFHAGAGSELDLGKLDRTQFAEFVEHSRDSFNGPVYLEEVVNSAESKRLIQELNRDISLLIRTNAKQSRQSWQLNAYSMADDPLSLLQHNNHLEDEETTLPADLVENLRLCHSTSIEFLRHFWLNLQDSSSTEKSLTNLLKGLKNSNLRIETIISEITSEEDKKIAHQVMQPLSESLNLAITHYEEMKNGALKHKVT